MMSGIVDIPEPSISSIIVVMLSSSISTVDKLPEVEKLDDDESSGVDEDMTDDEDGFAAFVVCLGSSLKPEPSISEGLTEVSALS